MKGSELFKNDALLHSPHVVHQTRDISKILWSQQKLSRIQHLSQRNLLSVVTKDWYSRPQSAVTLSSSLVFF